MNELNKFEEDLAAIIKNGDFRSVKQEFQEKLFIKRKRKIIIKFYPSILQKHKRNQTETR